MLQTSDQNSDNMTSTDGEEEEALQVDELAQILEKNEINVLTKYHESLLEITNKIKQKPSFAETIFKQIKTNFQ